MMQYANIRDYENASNTRHHTAEIDMHVIAASFSNIKAAFADLAASFDRSFAPLALSFTEMQLRGAKRVRNGRRRHGFVKHARDARRHAAKRVIRHLP